MSDSGFIKINKKITEWRWWHNNTARGLWLYLLVIANWKDTYNGQGIVIKRGQICRSLRTMAEDTELTVKTIRYWLTKFEEGGEISIDRAHHYNVISIVNYDKYQLVPSSKGTPSNTQSITPGNTPSITVRKNIKNIKNINKESKEKKRFTPPSLDDLVSYANEINYSDFDAQYFLDYYTSNGWTVGKNHMKDWKATVRNWKRREHTGNGRSQKVETPEWYKAEQNKMDDDEFYKMMGWDVEHDKRQDD